MLLSDTTAADRAVQFDVAVTASRQVKAKATGAMELLVVDASASADGKFSHEHASRVRFVVQVGQAIY